MRLVFINTVPILQVSKLKLKEIKKVAQSQKTNSQTSSSEGYGVSKRTLALEPEKPRFKSCLYHLLSLCLWTGGNFLEP